jgi:DNA-binding CsgD family transcriptional regulator
MHGVLHPGRSAGIEGFRSGWKDLGARYLPPVLHGRDLERERLAALLQDARGGTAGSVLVTGEPGVGKSTLLESVVGGATDALVLRTQGLESESPMAFAALQRLLRPVIHHVDRLPAPQGRAVAVAFGEEIGTVEPFLVALATLSLLSEVAEEQLLVCVVDDAHWLDTASSDALLFAARRLAADRVALLFAARDLGYGFAPEGVPVLALRGLEVDAVHALLVEGSGVEVAQEVVDRLAAETGGNPLALVEVPLGLSQAQLGGAEPLPPQLLLTSDVERVFLDRCRRLPPGAQRLLLVAAVDDTGSLLTVQRAAADLGARAGDLDEAERSGLLVVDGRGVSLRHPLVRSALSQAATVSERREAHLALARALSAAEDRDRATWHQAQGADGPDEHLVAALDAVAARAETRGGLLAAADAYERAAELSPDLVSAARRRLAAARNAWASGQTARASRLLADAREATAEPVLLADLDRLRARIAVNVGSADEAHRIFVRAVESVAPHDQERALEMAVAATVALSHGADGGARLAEAVVETSASTADTSRTRCLKQLLRCTRADLAGERATALNLLHDAVGTALGDDVTLQDLDLLGNLGNAALHLGDDEVSARCYGLMLSAARERGDAMAVLYALQRLSFVQYVAGRWVDLRASSEEAVALGSSLGQSASTAPPLAWLAILAALQGRSDFDERLRELEDLVDSRPPVGILAAPVRDLTAWAKGVRALLAGDGPGAWHHLSAIELPALRAMVAQDHMAAAVRAGEVQGAAGVVADLEAYAGATGLPWMRAAAAFGRAISVGDPAAAKELFQTSLVHHAQSDRPYDRARVQLAYGELLRRSQQRVEARRHLRAALETFTDLRATSLADRAAEELRASGETARKRDPSTSLDLTPMELKVAGLVSQGLSNKDVAAQCWISPRTVAFHLRNVFTKTGVTSRGELARLDLS